jgi:hypothetical protein
MTLDLDGLRAMGHNALCRVALGQIVSNNRTLRHADDVLPASVISALNMLHRQGFIGLAHPTAPARWPVAELTLTGMELLDRWNRQPATGTPNTLLASTSQLADVSSSAGTVAEVASRGQLS